ncbi:phosphohistidine phosphatase SixA [Proteus faecis]|uniref:Phosphohistidine phosphatase SixA n=1 Tax=Proteus faecis TaxID=2050967 RepID=A0AAW7CRU1_9GAMM|nr:phosphohistidine phosphatase SixA [Proteus faecis]MBG3013116.1 phosphohistidine phosphatase SixA [Proteus mirabilis]QNH64774.1 phosphohistidine phosphatase SixA [Proteus vulgaris]MCT8248521.1 phosphohistidine phosphatase SixA [Proteus faecis]MDL5168515.1 phosphohistidine phosphatase SixA [Proteus faecis]MDL5276500.1 phosphohistidine phosphatase SixA [Proteus faecis]
MQIFIMRHGEAAIDAASDALRPLTDRGKSESIKMAEWMTKQGHTIDYVLVSPYLRAQQTLDAVKVDLALPSKVETDDGLIPGGNPSHIAHYLRALGDAGYKNILVISHLPLVGYVVAELCPAVCAPMFSTSTIACVDFDLSKGAGALLWQVSPSILK